MTLKSARLTGTGLVVLQYAEVCEFMNAVMEKSVLTHNVANCGGLPHPANGQVLGADDKIIATYICDSGLVLVSSDTQVCQINGKWSGSPPICPGM